MTRIIKKKMYCPSCKREVIVPIMTSTNSNMVKNDPAMAKKMAQGKLFGYACPNCHADLEKNDNE